MLNVWKVVSFNRVVKLRIWEEWRRYAGHSKWQNIKHIKALKDGQRALMFTKMSRLIRVAIQEGKSADPQQNLLLAQAIERAKKYNMPVATIESSIKGAKDSKTASKPFVLEAKGPGSTLLLVSILTDNISRTKQELAAIVRKTSASLTDGSGRMFEYKGVLEVTPPGEVKLDTAEEHAIELGAEEVQEGEDGSLEFVCDGDHFYAVKKGLLNLQYSIKNADQVYIPKSVVNVSDEVLEDIANICHKLEQHPDVVKIYDNIA